MTIMIGMSPESIHYKGTMGEPSLEHLSDFCVQLKRLYLLLYLGIIIGHRDFYIRAPVFSIRDATAFQPPPQAENLTAVHGLCSTGED